MNIRDLRYLVAVAEHRHFGRAAEACFVSQPTLSTQIRKLEEQLGVQLIERQPRRIMLTPVGMEIVARARQILHEVEQIRRVARSARDPKAGTIRLGAFPTLAPYLLPHVLGPVRQRFPELKLLLVEEKTDELLHGLHAGRLDIAIMAEPVQDAALHAEPLFTEPFLLATPNGHPLAGRRDLEPDDLQGAQLLLLSEGHCLRDQALEICQLAGASEWANFRATSLEMLRQMVAAEVGITLLPLLSVQPPVPRTANISLTPFAKDAPVRRISMFWRRSSALDGFLQKLAASFAMLPAELLDPQTIGQAEE